MLENLRDTIEYIRSHIKVMPEFGIILGTGLGKLAAEVEVTQVMEYSEIPFFPLSTVESHTGRLIFGRLEGREVIVMQGRFHYYEGYSMQEVTYPVRVMKLLGIKSLVISNASGGLNPEYELSDLMIINDHINLMPEHPLRGKNVESFGPRFPDMSVPYNKEMINKAKKLAAELGIRVREGVYVGTQGPTLETPAEYQYMRTIGGDAVGMSTVPEVIVARHMDLPVFAISVITDLGVIGKIKEVSLEDVIQAASIAEPKMTKLIKALLRDL